MKSMSNGMGQGVGGDGNTGEWDRMRRKVQRVVLMENDKKG